MKPEHAVAAGGLCFLVIGGLLLAVSVYRGRKLCRVLAERMPLKYAELGSPLPGYFHSARRAAYFQFIMRRKFEELGDPQLAESFSRLHRFEVRQLVFLTLGFGALGVAYLWLHFAPAGHVPLP